DPWREATVSSDYHRRRSTSRQPIHVLTSGYHCSDLLTRFNIAPDIKQVQDTAVETFTKWIKEFVPGQRNAKKDLGTEIESLVRERDEASTTIPSVDVTPPVVDLGVVNSGVSTSPSSNDGASPRHVGPKNAWQLPPVQV
ncbi:hypothetical protein FRB91_004153, partial [Serendipita sp. 411]